MLSVDSSLTLQIRDALQSYVEGVLLTADGRFVCASCESCRSSVMGVQRSGERRRLITGEMPHVGRAYAINDDAGRSFRVVMLAKERGGNESNVSIEKRTSDMDEYASYKRKRTKRQIGCMLAMKILLGVDPTTGETASFSNQPAAHFFQTFSLTNSVMCSAKVDKGMSEEHRNARPTSTMLVNCRPHLKEILTILDPTVLIVQGNAAHKAANGALTTIPAKPIDDLIATTMNGHSLYVGSFSHPSSRPKDGKTWWQVSHPYFRDVVASKLSDVRESLASGT